VWLTVNLVYTRMSTWLETRRWLGTQPRSTALAYLEAYSGYTAQPHQRRAHLACAEDGAPSQKLFLGGIGAGKTMWGAAEDVLMAMINPGARGVVVAPTFDQVWSVVMPEFRDLCDEMARQGRPIVKRWLTGRKMCELVCGGEVYFRSFDRVDSIRGFNFGWVHLDESEQGRRPEYVFDTLHGRLRDTKAAQRQIHVTTTPKGAAFGVVAKFLERRNLADKLPARERRQDLRAWWTGRAKTTANKYLPEGYHESLRAGYSKRQYEQEIEARLLKPETVVYPEFRRDTHVIPWRYEPTLPYSVAVDWGHQYPHALWIQRRHDGSHVVFGEYCEDNIPRDHLRAEIVRACRALGRPPQYIVGDRAVKSENAWARDQYPGTHVRVMHTREEQSVGTGIEVVRALLDPYDAEPRLFIAEALTRDPPKRAIVNCMERYRYRQSADGQITLNPWKDNTHDHGADALRMYCVAVGMDRAGVEMLSRQHGGGGDRGWRRDVR